MFRGVGVKDCTWVPPMDAGIQTRASQLALWRAVQDFLQSFRSTLHATALVVRCTSPASISSSQASNASPVVRRWSCCAHSGSGHCT